MKPGETLNICICEYAHFHYVGYLEIHINF